ncbi:LacI family DNA-binding transcriptional regulator [Oceanobacillus jeddahense]|uniref:Substrate-binding domain-containing protein n=1 Tax=Oceanobacillus jeddahense TaxID=1462527 RepID=A0ABY5JPQ7_9BACI|nr:substrate-binding domain-containing protein [Oceanobacillus jeddahense]UUI02282.1 substrate-binding domain-containing protein [Oceanobacillus jeddahense]
MKRVTMADVAKYAGVSKSTISQYLNGRFDYMSEETRVKIGQAVKDLNYRPNMVARSLKQKSSTTIGVIVANILHVFSTQVIRAIEDFCHQRGFHVIVCNADDQPEKEKKYIEMLKAKQVDGIIAFPTGDNVELYQQLLDEGYPLVFMDRIVKELKVDTILLDNEEAARLAAETLLQGGYKHIAMISPPLLEQVTPRVERVNAFQESIQKMGQQHPEVSLITGKISTIYEKLDTLFQKDKHPDAIFAINDRVLHEVLSFLSRRNIQIPDDVAMINVDDVSFADFYNPPLTTISQPAFDMGKKAAEILFAVILKEKTDRHPETMRFKPILVRRKSC